LLIMWKGYIAIYSKSALSSSFDDSLAFLNKQILAPGTWNAPDTLMLYSFKNINHITLLCGRISLVGITWRTWTTFPPA